MALPALNVMEGDVNLVESERTPCCIRQRSTLEKILLVALTLISAVIIALAIFIVISIGTKEKTPELCLNESCIKIATRIFEAMDQSMDPCEDFYEYACGNWRKTNSGPEDVKTGLLNVRDKVNYKNLRTVRELLEEPESSDEPKSTRNAKRLYSSCINTDLMLKQGDKPWQDFVDNLGGWPIFEPKWNETQCDYLQLLSKATLLNAVALIALSVNDFSGRIELSVADVKTGDLEVPDDNPKQFNMSHAANPATVEEDIRDMVDFEHQLDLIHFHNTSMRHHSCQGTIMTVADLYTNVSKGFDWHRYMNLVFSNVSITIPMHQEVQVCDSEALRGYILLLNETPKRTVCNYMMWMLLVNLKHRIPLAFSGGKREHYDFSGGGMLNYRWEYCVDITTDAVPFTVTRLYINQNLEELNEDRVQKMTHIIREAFKKRLQHIEWFDEQTRTKALEKEDAMVVKISYPDLNETAVDTFEGNFDADKYFGNFLTISNSIVQNDLRCTVHPRYCIWLYSTWPVDVVYHRYDNHIMIPAGILQPPYYNDAYPMSLNFGSMGTMFAARSIQGFNYEGSNYDKYGQRKRWWSNTTDKRYSKAKECIMQMYIDSADDLRVASVEDNAGVKVAFQAYHDWLRLFHPDEPELPLPHSHDQLFFLQYAQINCGYGNIPRDQVTGTLSNSKEFAQAYKCPLGSKMNPKDKCDLW